MVVVHAPGGLASSQAELGALVDGAEKEGVRMKGINFLLLKHIADVQDSID